MATHVVDRIEIGRRRENGVDALVMDTSKPTCITSRYDGTG